MRISLALGRRPVNVQTAWGCLTSNLAMPGVGSLLAGRKSGYAQLAVAMVATVITTVFGLKFCYWYLQNLPRFQDAVDPAAALSELFLHVRWALLGLGLFGFVWLWSLATGMSILSEAKAAERSAAPPKLN